MRNEPFRKALADSRVPPHLHGGLVSWVELGVPPGGFLKSVLENDLTKAVLRADDTSLFGLRPLLQFLINEAPAPCWGSLAAVAHWPEFITASNRRDEDHTKWAVGAVVRELTEKDLKS